MYPIGPKWVNVGDTYSNMARVDMLFTYTAGSATTLGVGFSPSFLGGTDPGPGSLGLTFTQNSSMSWNSSITEPYAGHHGIVNDAYYTRFTYGAFFTICAGESLQPIGFADGTRHQQVPGFASENSYCAPHEATSRPVVIVTGSGTSNTAGVSIAAAAGINLSSQTDHSHSTEEDFTFPRGGKLCGTANYAGDTARGGNTIYAGLYHHSPPGRK